MDKETLKNYIKLMNIASEIEKSKEKIEAILDELLSVYENQVPDWAYESFLQDATEEQLDEIVKENSESEESHG
jgi:Glu-tRNA(Gln) amidotransferase subunit E-like FAD-binding protein